MSITMLDARSALIVIDLQQGLASIPGLAPIVPRAGALAAAFRRHGLPVVLASVDGGPSVRTERPRRVAEMPPGFADLLPELDAQPQDHRVVKRTPGAFTKTDLETYLKAQGVTQIVLAGVATSNGVEATARQAFELGLNIAFAIDAMMDLDAQAHENSVGRIFPRLGETGSAQDIIDLLGGARA